LGSSGFGFWSQALTNRLAPAAEFAGRHAFDAEEATVEMAMLLNPTNQCWQCPDRFHEQLAGPLIHVVDEIGEGVARGAAEEP
jgi:hypothetical protein